MLSAKRYATGWWFCWSGLSCLVAAVAFLAWPIEIAVLFVLSGGVTTIVVVRRRRAAAGHAATPAVRVGALTGVMFAAFIGCGKLGGNIIWPILLVAVLTCPALISRMPRLSSIRSSPHVPRKRKIRRRKRTDHETNRAVDGMSDAELCQAWCDSLAMLARRPPGDRYTVVLYRQACLDELERRHPAEIHRWLQSEPRPTTNPGTFFNDE